MQSNISWLMCVGICMDRTASMVGSIKGFITLAKEINTNTIHTHYIARHLFQSHYHNN